MDHENPVKTYIVETKTVNLSSVAGGREKKGVKNGG